MSRVLSVFVGVYQYRGVIFMKMYRISAKASRYLQKNRGSREKQDRGRMPEALCSVDAKRQGRRNACLVFFLYLVWFVGSGTAPAFGYNTRCNIHNAHSFHTNKRFACARTHRGAQIIAEWISHRKWFFPALPDRIYRLRLCSFRRGSDNRRRRYNRRCTPYPQ